MLALGRSLISYPGMPHTRVPPISEKPAIRAKKPKASRTDPQAHPVQPDLWNLFTPGPPSSEPIEETPPRPSTTKSVRRRSRSP